MPQTLPDLLLIERARSGDSSAIEALIRRYGARLFRVAHSVLLDPQRAEGVVLEAFLAAFADLSRYEPTGKFAAWLTRLAYGHARAQRALSRGMHAVAGTPEDIGTGLDSLRERAALEQSIMALPEVFRTVYVLRMVEGISGIETAASLGLHETTVRTRLFRSHRRLPPGTAERLRALPPLLELSPERLEHIATQVLAARAHQGSQGSPP
ncbi:MAG: sigma-70 family RNA polymerase sigma factor [Gammaproteobacteria bacterium]|nr:sigma-70 family RNA polymerase sigma factor [Gammaproteobacteria bacterium]MBV8405177.1 sigma-70 family RNA polymerase sigma factor [Gammaproteobacteria bacterium]